MSQKKAHEVDGWLARPDRKMAIVLIYGPDRGLVSERASAFVKAAGLPPDDPFSVVKLAAEDVDKDAGRLVDEMRTIPMFSDRRLVWLRTVSPTKAVVDAVRVFLDEPPTDAILLIEAGDLKKGAPLRSLVEGASAAIALPCYADEARSLDTIIDATVSAAGMTITLDARQALKRNLGGDRLASRSEIDKLVLYAQGEPQITADHVEALAGDASGPSLDAVIDAVLLGKIDEFDAAFLKITATNQLVPLLTSALRQFQSLDLLRNQVESGERTAAAAVASAKPPVFFARRETMEKAVSRWSSQLIRRALDRIQTVVLQSRERSGLSIPLVRQALLGLAYEAARRL